MENEFVEWGSWGAFVVDLSVCWLWGGTDARRKALLVVSTATHCEMFV
jgi:hypothetical protein